MNNFKHILYLYAFFFYGKRSYKNLNVKETLNYWLVDRHQNNEDNYPLSSFSKWSIDIMTYYLRVKETKDDKSNFNEVPLHTISQLSMFSTFEYKISMSVFNPMILGVKYLKFERDKNNITKISHFSLPIYFISYSVGESRAQNVNIWFFSLCECTMEFLMANKLCGDELNLLLQ